MYPFSKDTNILFPQADYRFKNTKFFSSLFDVVKDSDLNASHDRRRFADDLIEKSSNQTDNLTAERFPDLI